MRYDGRKGAARRLSRFCGRPQARDRPSSLVFHAPGAKHTQGEQAEKGSPPAEILAIFTVEGAGVAGGVLRARIALRAARATITPATPKQGFTFARETKAMT